MTVEEVYEAATRNLSREDQGRLIQMLREKGGASRDGAVLEYDDVWTDEDLRALGHASLRYAEEKYGPADDLV